MCGGPANVLEVPLKGFTYLYDFCSDPAAPPEIGEREDRTLLAYGLSQKAERERDGGRMRGLPGSDERGDRGHLISHAAGGGLDINVFHQDAYLNRGWSPQGKMYRSIERYCADNEGTFFFSRLLYDDDTARPSEIELGVLRDGSLWVELFGN